MVGPTGVFVIETKAHHGTVHAEGDRVLVNGHLLEKDFISQSWRNTFWLRDLLKNTAALDVPVTPILVFPNAFVAFRHLVKGVRVINKKFLTKTILREHVTDYPVERVVELLTRKFNGS